MGILETGKNVLSIANDVTGNIRDIAGNVTSVTNDIKSLVSMDEEAEALVSEDSTSETSVQNDITEVKQVNSIPELQDHLVALKDMQGETALAYALQAQLQVLQVVQSPSLSGSMFDILLESLYTAIEKTENESQKKLIQQKSAIMINSMIFFMEAKIHYESKKWTDEGLNLLKQGCDMVADSAPAIIGLVVSRGTSIMIDGSALLNNLTQNRTFLKRIFEFFAGGQREKIEQMQKELNLFLVSVVDKLDKYKDLFGKSIILAELVDRFIPVVIQKKTMKPKSPRKPQIGDFMRRSIPLYEFKMGEVIKPSIGWEIGILAFLFVILGIMKLIDLIPAVNLENARFWLWTIIKFGSLVAPVIVIGVLFAKIIGLLQHNGAVRRAEKQLVMSMPEYNAKYEEYKHNLERYEDKCDQLEKYYQSLSKSFRFGA